jgi:hypothetical protein
LGKNDKALRHRECDMRAMILCDKRKRDIDACGHARRGHKIAVAHVDAIQVDAAALTGQSVVVSHGWFMQ